MIDRYPSHIDDHVKPRRRYTGVRRQAGARETQRRIVETAHRIFVEQGYVPTTVRQVADAADVSPQTIYAAFETKAGLFTRVFDIAIVGDDEPVPLVQREPYRRTFAATTLEQALGHYAVACRTTFESYASLYPVLLAGTAADPALAAYHRTNMIENRGRGQRFLAEHLHRQGWLQTSIDEAADSIWALCSPDLHLAVTGELGWTPDGYESWLTQMLRAALT